MVFNCCVYFLFYQFVLGSKACCHGSVRFGVKRRTARGTKKLDLFYYADSYYRFPDNYLTIYFNFRFSIIWQFYA